MNKFFPRINYAPEGVESAPSTALAEDSSVVSTSSAEVSTVDSDFGGLSQDYDLDVDSLVDPAPALLTPAGSTPNGLQTTPEKPVTVPPVPVPPTQPVQQPVAQPQAPLQEQNVAPSKPVTKTPETLDDMLSIFQANEGTLIDAIAASEFQLTPEDISGLELDVTTAVPKLLARAYSKTMQGMMHIMREQVPKMVMQQVGTYQRQMQIEQDFFQQNPGLNRSAHGKDITQVASFLRQQNPQMPVSELLAKTAQTVAALHGIGLQASPTQQTPAPMTRQVAPFTPAMSAPRTVAVSPALAPDDFFGGLSQHYDEQ